MLQLLCCSFRFRVGLVDFGKNARVCPIGDHLAPFQLFNLDPGGGQFSVGHIFGNRPSDRARLVDLVPQKKAAQNGGNSKHRTRGTAFQGHTQ